MNPPSGDAGAGNVDGLRETVGSLDAQLVALYEEKLRAGARTHAELRETLASLEAQLTALYSEREEEDFRLSVLQQATANLAEQLREFYGLQEQLDGRPLAELVAQVQSFEAQLEALYAEQEQRAMADRLGPDAEALRVALASFEQQLAVLYEEKAQPVPEVLMVESLEAQVRALLDEKQELEQALAERTAAVVRAQERARALVSTLVEKSLALD